MPGEDPTPTLPELPSTDEWGLSNAPVKKWTNKDLAPVKPPVKYSDVSQDPHGALPPVGGAQDQLLADAKGTLAQTDPMAAMLWPKAAAMKQAHPGAYDDLTHQQLTDMIDVKAAQSSRGQGYQPGLADSPMGAGGPARFNAPQSASPLDLLGLLGYPVHTAANPTGLPSVAEAKGFGAGEANFTQSGLGKTLLSGAAMIPGGAIPATAVEMAGGLASKYLDEPNAPQSMGEFTGNTGEVAASGLLGNLLGKAPGAISKIAPRIAAMSPVKRAVGGAAIGGAGGYMTGGVKGAVGGAVAGAGVGLGVGTSPSLKVLKALANTAPETAVAGEAATAGETAATTVAGKLKPLSVGGDKLSPELSALIRARNPEIMGGTPTPSAAAAPAISASPQPTSSSRTIRWQPVKPDSPVQDLFGYQKDRIQAMRDAVQAGKAGEGVAAAEVAHPGAQNYMDKSFAQSKQQLDQIDEARQMAKDYQGRPSPTSAAPSSDLMSAFLDADKSGRVGNFEMDGVKYHEDPSGSSVADSSTPAPGTATEAEYGMSFPNETAAPASPPVTAAMAKRLVELKKMMGGRQ
jgi:hypothetical protein